MKITEQTPLDELAIELSKLGVQICQVSIMPAAKYRCDLADHAWARGHGVGGTIAEAIDAGLVSLREQIALLHPSPAPCPACEARLKVASSYDRGAPCPVCTKQPVSLDK